MVNLGFSLAAMKAKANILTACPLGKLEPASLSSTIVAGIVMNGLGLGMASFSGSATNVPMTIDAKISMPSLLRRLTYNKMPTANMRKVDPNRVRTLKNQPKYGLARPLLIDRNTRVSQLNMYAGKGSTEGWNAP